MQFKKDLIKALDEALKDYYLRIKDNITPLSEKAYDMVATEGKKYAKSDIEKTLEEVKNAVNPSDEKAKLLEELEKTLEDYYLSSPDNVNDLSERAYQIVASNGENFTKEEIKKATSDLKKAMQEKKDLVAELDRILNKYYRLLPDNVNGISDKAYDIVATDGKKYTNDEIRKAGEALINAMTDREQLIKELDRVLDEYYKSTPDNVNEMSDRAYDIVASMGKNSTAEDIKASLKELRDAMQAKRDLIKELDKALDNYYLEVKGNVNELSDKAYDMVATDGKAYTMDEIKQMISDLNEAAAAYKDETERREAVEAFRKALAAYSELLGDRTNDLRQFAEATNAHLDQETTERIKETTARLLAAIKDFREGTPLTPLEPSVPKDDIKSVPWTE